jgi:RNA polymerase sigma factor CnrH
MESAIQEIAPRLLRYCLARMGDRAAAEEVAQESLAALVHRWRSHGPPESAEAFAFAVARRRSGRALFRRRLWVPIEYLLYRRDEGPDPETMAIDKNERQRLVSGVARLPRREREALLLVAVGGLDIKEAARVLHISPSALKMRTLRARRNLAAVLESYDARLPSNRRATQRAV